LCGPAWRRWRTTCVSNRKSREQPTPLAGALERR
jgi:hypothetical protein